MDAARPLYSLRSAARGTGWPSSPRAYLSEPERYPEPDLDLVRRQALQVEGVADRGGRRTDVSQVDIAIANVEQQSVSNLPADAGHELPCKVRLTLRRQ